MPITICLIICGARTIVLFKIVVKIIMLVKYLYMSHHSCWLLNLDWLGYVMQRGQYLLNTWFLGVRIEITPNHIPLKFEVSILLLHLIYEYLPYKGSMSFFKVGRTRDMLICKNYLSPWFVMNFKWMDHIINTKIKTILEIVCIHMSLFLVKLTL